jgi:putative peptidoglycan lipid II flippase
MATWGTRLGLEHWLGTEGLWVQLVELAIASAVGLGVFIPGALMLPIPEAGQLSNRLRQRFFSRPS